MGGNPVCFPISARENNWQDDTLDMQSTETGEEGERVTREENLLYRRSCPYDAMGDYSLLIENNR